jgi:tRNA-specific 2-thiouridylase
MGAGPWYVVKKDLAKNIVYVAHSERYLEHAKEQFTVANLHWINEAPTKTDLQTKVRHSPRLEPCTVRLVEGSEGSRAEVTLQTKDQGIAPGQSAVFYDGEYCLGTGVIE